jgi:hypothetical protein
MNAGRESSCRSQPISTPARCDGQRNAALIPGRQSTQRCAGHRVQACESCRQRCTGRRPPIIRCVSATRRQRLQRRRQRQQYPQYPQQQQHPQRPRQHHPDVAAPARLPAPNGTRALVSSGTLPWPGPPFPSSLGFPCSHRGRLASRRRAKITQRQPLPGTAISRLSRQLSSHPLCLHSSPALANIGALRPVYHPVFPPSLFLGRRPHRRCAGSSYAPCNFISGPGNFTPVLRGYTGFGGRRASISLPPA